MKRVLSFDDVLMVPQFSEVLSRKDVDVSTVVSGDKLGLGIISSNMNTVTDAKVSREMHKNGARGCLHRFQSIQENVSQWLESTKNTWVSFGVGGSELERAEALVYAGADYLLLDVAHGASRQVVEQVKKFRDKFGNNVYLTVGNFATGRAIQDFVHHVGSLYAVDAFKSGIGPGSACTTRQVTGCGIPLFSSLQDCVQTGYDIIADGGIRNSGDFAKALAVGAKAVMVGRVIAATEESPAELVHTEDGARLKRYKGSASQASYVEQGKVASHRTAEGASVTIPVSGTISEVLQQFEAGLRSAMAYAGAKDLADYRERAEFVEITHGGLIESGAHAKQT